MPSGSGYGAPGSNTGVYQLRCAVVLLRTARGLLKRTFVAEFHDMTSKVYGMATSEACARGYTARQMLGLGYVDGCVYGLNDWRMRGRVAGDGAAFRFERWNAGNKYEQFPGPMERTDVEGSDFADVPNESHTWDPYTPTAPHRVGLRCADPSGARAVPAAGRRGDDGRGPDRTGPDRRRVRPPTAADVEERRARRRAVGAYRLRCAIVPFTVRHRLIGTTVVPMARKAIRGREVRLGKFGMHII